MKKDIPSAFLNPLHSFRLVTNLDANQPDNEIAFFVPRWMELQETQNGAARGAASARIAAFDQSALLAPASRSRRLRSLRLGFFLSLFLFQTDNGG
jgi:hypothetical protein